MNEPFAVAQADIGDTAATNKPARTIKVRKPLSDQAVTVELGYDQNYKLDLSAIADEKITLIRLGEKLIILFDNKSTVTVEPFFNSANAPLPNITVEATGRDFTSGEFVAYFPIAADQSVLTAAGDSAASGSPSSGANFRGTAVDPLGVPKPLDLLGQEDLPNVEFGPHPFGVPESEESSSLASPDSDPETPPTRPLAPTLTAAGGIAHDETPGVQAGPDPNSANDVDGTDVPAAILALFNGIGAAQGLAESAGSLATPSGGSVPATIEYALIVSDGIFSGVGTTEGTQVFLFNGTGPAQGLILGRVGIESGATDIADPNGALAFALAVDPADGNGYVAQFLSLQHPQAGGSPAALDDAIALAPGSVQIQVTYGDGVGNFATSAPLDIGQAFGFQDDGPSAGAVTKSISGAGHDTNVMLILDVSGSMGTQSGLAGLTRLDVLQAAVNELLEQYGALGNVRVQIVAFASAASQVGTDWMTIAEAKAAVDSLTAGGNTNYDAAVALAQTVFTHAGKLAAAEVQNVSYFMSDGAPNLPGGSVGISAGEEGAWAAFLAANDIDSHALGMGAGVTQSALNPLAFNGVTGANANSIVVTDPAQIAPVLVGTVETTSGNLLTDGVLPGAFGSDDGYVRSIAADGTIYTYDPAAGTVVANGTDHGTFDPASHQLTVTLASGGVLNIDMDDGTFAYSGLSNVGGSITEIFPFDLSDNDGDTAASTLTIVSNAADHAPIVRDDHVITNVGGDSGIGIVIPDFALLFNDTDIDGQAIAVAGLNNVAGAISVSQSGGNAVFVDDDSSGGSFSYTGATAPAGSDTGDVSIDRSQTGNALTGTGLGEIFVGRDGTGSTINANAGNDVLIGGNAGDALNGGAGNDLLAGYGGTDVLNGGAGADHFRFSAPSDGLDGVVDFSTADGDLIEILGAAFGGLSSGALAPSLFVSNAGGNFTDSTQRFAFDTTTKTLYYDSDGSSAAAQIALAHLENGANLSSTDIYVV
jgi:Ca2+-binding RTX toxin-like protein